MNYLDQLAVQAAAIAAAVMISAVTFLGTVSTDVISASSVLA
ncbi:hypothetical protein [Altererythrobacter aquiaggeris]